MSPAVPKYQPLSWRVRILEFQRDRQQVPDHGSERSVMVHRLAFFQAPHQPERSSVGVARGQPASLKFLLWSLWWIKVTKASKLLGPYTSSFSRRLRGPSSSRWCLSHPVDIPGLRRNWKGITKWARDWRQTFVLWLGWRLSCLYHCRLSRCIQPLWLWSSHMAGKWSPGSLSLRNLLRRRSFPKMNEKNVTYLLRMWHIFTPMCGSVSFKWLWHGPTVTQREIFFISLYLYIFSFTYWTYCVWACLCV